MSATPDLHYREGGIGADFPYLLGHEAAGTVEAVGPGSGELAAGDRVVLNWRAVCGECRASRRGRPWHCFDTHNASQPMTLADGTPLSPALGIGAFAEKTLVAAGQCTALDTSPDPAAAGLIGCGVMAGWGAAVNTAPVRHGDTVAVIGCGGVGDAAIAGAVYAGARQVIAVDTDPRKLAWAQGFGATDMVDTREGDVVSRLRELTGGYGPDVVIDAVGRPETFRQAFAARPGRHGGAGRRTHPGDDRGAAAGRDLRPRRRDEVILVRRLPALARLPATDRPVAPRPVPAGRVRLRADRSGRCRGRVREDAPRRGPAQRRRPLIREGVAVQQQLLAGAAGTHRAELTRLLRTVLSSCIHHADQSAGAPVASGEMVEEAGTFRRRGKGLT